jgi:uncharacterized integral membrane protein
MMNLEDVSSMVRKILAAVILVPLGLVIVGLAVANREIVSVSFDPFNAANPAFALKAPLFLLVLILVTVGVIIGGVAAWLKQSKWRRAARRLEAELRDERAEVDAVRRRLAASEARPPATPLALRPPAA